MIGEPIRTPAGLQRMDTKKTSTLLLHYCEQPLPEICGCRQTREQHAPACRQPDRWSRMRGQRRSRSDKDDKTNRCDRLRRCSRHWLPLDSQGERLPSAPSSSSVFGVRSPRAASGILEATPSVDFDALAVFGAWGRAPLSTPVPTREQQKISLLFLITRV